MQEINSRVRQSNLFVFMCRNRKYKYAKRKKTQNALSVLCCGEKTTKRRENTPIQTSLFCKSLKVFMSQFAVSQMHSMNFSGSIVHFPHSPKQCYFEELLFDSSIACRLTVFSFWNKKLISIYSPKNISIYRI